MFLANNRSAFQHPEFVSQAICELLENDCIIEHRTPPFCANPFSVAEGKKLGFVIDLRHVNNFLVSGFKFKSEDLRSLSQVLEEGRWFFYMGSQVRVSPYLRLCGAPAFLGFS